MELNKQLMAEISRRNTDYVANYIGNDPELFKQLINVLFNGVSPLPHRASWVFTVYTYDKRNYA